MKAVEGNGIFFLEDEISNCGYNSFMMVRLFIAFLLLFITGTGSVFPQSQLTKSAPLQAKISTLELREKMSTLWQENSYWTRNLMISILDTMPGNDQALWRLIKNQEEICKLFKDFFDDESQIALMELLYSDVNFRIELIKLAPTDSLLAMEARERWRRSVNAIAEYLHKLNSKWMLRELNTLFNEQVDTNYELIRQRTMREYDLELIAFDKMMINAARISKVLTQGLIYQYPQKFTDITPRIAASK